MLLLIFLFNEASCIFIHYIKKHQYSCGTLKGNVFSHHINKFPFQKEDAHLKFSRKD